ncbi:hypothetical protein KEM54_001020 [Ascosphaera aggregata]|nr:hypothetical protein KEM54_001020 [Ascosphaera aggregata]
MANRPLINFKAGICELDTSVTPNKVKAKPDPGYLYLYEEDQITHFCWRPRSSPSVDPEIDLFMVPGDGSFVPYRPSDGKSPTNGRIFVLKFSSSSQRYLFYLQSRSRDLNGDPAFWSARDLKLGEVINAVLQGQEVGMTEELIHLHRYNREDDQARRDAARQGQDNNASNNDQSGAGGSGASGGAGGAGPDAAGGDVREEGEGSREGGADGGRASSRATATDDPNALVQNLIRSLGSDPAVQANATGQPSNQTTTEEDTIYTTLGDLLKPDTTMPFIDSADAQTVDNLLSFLPADLPKLVSSKGGRDSDVVGSTTLSMEQKKDLLRKVLRSPQFVQSSGSLTNAIHEGGLPSISDALQIKVENDGYIPRSGLPLSAGVAVRVFLEGVKRHVQAKDQNAADSADRMDTD